VDFGGSVDQPSLPQWRHGKITPDSARYCGATGV
jgi:hypothetical protein